MPEAVGIDGRDAGSVERVEPVRPAFHQARGGEGAGAHRRAGPGQAGLGFERAQRGLQAVAAGAPPVDQLHAGERARLVLAGGAESVFGAAAAGQLGRAGGDRGGLFVDLGEVRDHVADEPAVAGRRRFPVRVGRVR